MVIMTLIGVALDITSTEIDIFILKHGLENHLLPALFIQNLGDNWIAAYPVTEFAIVFGALWAFHLGFVKIRETSHITYMKYLLIVFLYANVAHNFSIMLFGQPILPRWL